MTMRRWVTRRFGSRLVGPVLDIWAGGAGADGRGLDAANGGSGLGDEVTISSPTADPGPSGQVRYLIRDAAGVWQPKGAGVLAGIGGRVWTGSAWTYTGASSPTFLGPLPTLDANTTVTDTVRRYSTGGDITVSDVTGGVIQSYAQKVDLSGVSGGGGYSVTPYEARSNPVSGTQFYIHAILEFLTTAAQPRPNLGLHDGSTFPYGTIEFDPLVPSVLTSGVQAGIRSLGTGPNGGALVELWASQVTTTTHATINVLCYWLRRNVTTDVNSVVIHNHDVIVLPSGYGRLYGYPPFLRVSAGQSAALVQEGLTFGPAGYPATWLFGIDLADTPSRPLDANSYRLVAADGDDVVTPLYLSLSNVKMYPPSENYGTFSLTTRSVAVSLGTDKYTRGYADGVLLGAPASPLTIAATPPRWQIGQDSTSSGVRALVPIRRILGWRRVLTASEVLAAHQAYTS